MSKLDIKATALQVARIALEEVDVLWVDDYLYGQEIQADEDDLAAIVKAVGDLVVATRTDVPKAYAWKTVIEDRWPREKLHKTLGLARQAISYGYYARPGRIEELRGDNEWHIIFETDGRTRAADLPWRKK